jgi:transcription elongation factor S-II
MVKNKKNNSFQIKSFYVLAIYKELNDTGVKYRNRIRSRISNLKDAKNPNLRINVLLGIITPERLAVLTAEVSFLYFKIFLTNIN